MESLFLSYVVSVEPSNMSDLKRNLTFIFCKHLNEYILLSLTHTYPYTYIINSIDLDLTWTFLLVIFAFEIVLANSNNH